MFVYCPFLLERFTARDQRRVFASKRGTYDLNGSGFKADAAGSDKSVAFWLPCDPALDWVAMFEAPIDLMSFRAPHRQAQATPWPCADSTKTRWTPIRGRIPT